MPSPLTTEQAVAATTNDPSYPLLSQAGTVKLAKWLNETAHTPRAMMLPGWVRHIEKVACDSRPSEAVRIEMSGSQTNSGSTELIVFNPEDFEWWV